VKGKLWVVKETTRNTKIRKKERRSEENGGGKYVFDY
jgi:hypothetical protein